MKSAPKFWLMFSFSKELRSYSCKWPIC